MRRYTPATKAKYTEAIGQLKESGLLTDKVTAGVSLQPEGFRQKSTSRNSMRVRIWCVLRTDASSRGAVWKNTEEPCGDTAQRPRAWSPSPGIWD